MHILANLPSKDPSLFSNLEKNVLQVLKKTKKPSTLSSSGIPLDAQAPPPQVVCNENPGVLIRELVKASEQRVQAVAAAAALEAASSKSAMVGGKRVVRAPAHRLANSSDRAGLPSKVARTGAGLAARHGESG
mmetsp:Transcript_18523/g.39770  ORF Transcript_18523/g.39770 Transcript_18523/m.39770 type:complete len:133 (-) Transcript_18523:850-1248(-)